MSAVSSAKLNSKLASREKGKVQSERYSPKSGTVKETPEEVHDVRVQN